MVNLRKRVYLKRVNNFEESKFHWNYNEKHWWENLNKVCKDGKFPWNYVSNKILGRSVRKSVVHYAHASHAPRAVCHLHSRPVSSWCNTTLAPPAPYRTLTRNSGYNRFAIMLGTAGIRLKNSLCRRDYVITRRGVER